jgi:hypothetical protein
MSHATTLTAAAAALVVALPASAQQFTGFEDLAPMTTFNSGDAFTTSGIPVQATDYVTSSGSSSGGFARVDANSQLTGDPVNPPSNEVNLNNVTLTFSFDQTYTELRIDLGDFGGLNTFEINGEKIETFSFGDFVASNPTVGGVTFTGSSDPVTLTTSLLGVGEFDSFSIAGQELWIDNVSAIPAPGAAAFALLAAAPAIRRRRTT